MTITRRSLIQSAMAAALVPAFTAIAADSAPSAEDIVLADRTLAEAWARLRPKDREVLALALLEDLPVGAIATALGVSANAVSIRLHRAKRALAVQLAGSDPVES